MYSIEKRGPQVRRECKIVGLKSRRERGRNGLCARSQGFCELSLLKTSSAYDQPRRVADGGNLAVERKRVLDRQAESAKSSSPAGKRSGLGWRILCVGSPVHRRISETIIADSNQRSLKRRGVGIADGVLQVEESGRCACILASPGFSTLQGPWTALGVSWNAGSRRR
jgi:hypothetical protein